MDLFQFVITRQGQGQEEKNRPTCIPCQIGFPISYIIIQSVGPCGMYLVYVDGGQDLKTRASGCARYVCLNINYKPLWIVFY